MSDWRFKRNGFKRTVPTWTFWPNRKITLSKVKSVKSGSLPGYIKSGTVRMHLEVYSQSNWQDNSCWNWNQLWIMGWASVKLATDNRVISTMIFKWELWLNNT